MGNPRVPIPDPSTRPRRHHTGTWIRVLLVLLISEKVIQHLVVSAALLLDLKGIRGSLALNYRFFLVAGAFEALLFVCGGWGVLQKSSWAWWLLVVLALMDIVGEFVAQGTLMIRLNISIMVAVMLLVVSLLYRQRTSDGLHAVAAK